MTTLILKGQPGQGIQLLGFILANFLKDQGYFVAFASRYSPLVRAGKTQAHLVFSGEKIDNPLIEKADWEYDLSGKKLQEELLEKCSNPKIINMVLLGMILKKLGLERNEKKIKKYLPKRFLEENLAAINHGYEV